MFTTNDFRKMKIPPITNGEYSPIKPIHSMYSFEPESKKDKRRVINYILLMYDPESPFVKRYQNVERRISAVSDYVGLKNLPDEGGERIMEYNNIVVLKMINDYVKWLHIRLWSLIVVSETTFYEYQRELMLQVTGADSKDKLTALEKKTKILDALDKISSKLDSYYSRLYANDKDLEKKIEQTKMVTPEAIASGEFFEI